MRHSIGLLISLAVLPACDSSSIPGGVGSSDLALAMADLVLAPAPDLAVSTPADLSLPPADLTSPPADMSGFCGNPASGRVKLNGKEALTPTVSAQTVYLNCCEAGTIDFVSMQIAQPVSLVWRYFGVGPMPAVIDLANLPKSWTVSIWSGCSPAQPNCQPTDQLTVGLRGTLAISGQQGAYKVSACVDAAEAPGQPQPVLHDVHLWTPTIAQK